MFDELYQDPYDAIRDRNIAVGRLDDWGAMAADVGSMAGMLGRAGSKALGATYEEDLVNDILLKGQHDTPEGQAATLQALSQVSPGAFMKVQQMYEDMNLGNLKLEEKQLEVKAKKGESDRNRYWRTKVEPNVITELASKYGIKANNMDDIVITLNAAVESGKITTGTRSNTISQIEKSLEKERKDWNTFNKYRDFSSISKGLSNVTTTSPSDNKAEKIDITTTTKDPSYVPPTQEEYDADPRPLWQKGTIWNYRRPKKVDTNSDNVGGA